MSTCPLVQMKILDIACSVLIFRVRAFFFLILEPKTASKCNISAATRLAVTLKCKFPHITTTSILAAVAVIMADTVVPGFRVLGFSALPGFRALNAHNGAWSVHKTLFGFRAPISSSV